VERLPSMGTRPSDVERAEVAKLAAAAPPLRLVAEPKPASRDRPTQETRWGEMRVASADASAGLEADRLKLAALIGRETTFVPAPAYDEEHPEELSYRPFPIAPFLTATSSADDPALARMVHPDLAKTLEMLDQVGSVPPMRLRPGAQTARLMWTQEFRGEAIDLSSLIDLEQSKSPAQLAKRRVATQSP
jgi:hypothetical protein